MHTLLCTPRQLICTICILAAVAAFTSCGDNDCISGSGAVVSETLELDAFHTVIANASFLVTIEQADQQRVVANGQANIINELRTDVSNGIWTVEFRNDRCFTDFDLEVRIFLPDLERVRSSGSGNVVLNTFDDLDFLIIESAGSGRTFQSGILSVENNLSIVQDGSGDIDVQFDVQNLNILADGSGNINILGGTVIGQDIVLAGSGNVSAFSLDSETCVVRNSGSGNVEVSVFDSLNVTISGSGDVRYKGTPAITSEVTGSGSLVDAN